jgi:hypothetical protein
MLGEEADAKGGCVRGQIRFEHAALPEAHGKRGIVEIKVAVELLRRHVDEVAALLERFDEDRLGVAHGDAWKKREEREEGKGEKMCDAADDIAHRGIAAATSWT